MIYLSGKIEPRLYNQKNIGFIHTPWGGTPPPKNHIWGMDSGCFSNKNFTWLKYYSWLIRKCNYDCIFVPVPDVVGNAQETLKLFNKFYSLFKNLPCNIAFVAQDGTSDIDIPWEKFHTLFIGGTTDWKLGEEVKQLIKQGQYMEKWIHIGRVNTISRMKYFAEMKVDSVDGTCAIYGPNVNIPKLIRWINKINEDYYTS